MIIIVLAWLESGLLELGEIVRQVNRLRRRDFDKKKKKCIYLNKLPEQAPREHVLLNKSLNWMQYGEKKER